jgi:hypothetical protein
MKNSENFRNGCKALREAIGGEKIQKKFQKLRIWKFRNLNSGKKAEIRSYGRRTTLRHSIGSPEYYYC